MPTAQSYAYHHPNSKTGENERSCCSLSCLKFSLYVYNLASLTSGLAVLAICLWIIIDRDQVLAPYSVKYTALALSGLGLGAFIVLTTVVGCCGISRESHFMLFLYTALCGVMIIAELSGGIAAYVYRQEVHEELVTSLNTTVAQKYGLYNSSTSAVDALQSKLECCGVESFEDWRSSYWSTSTVRANNKVPDSCCKTVSRNCGVRDHPSNIYYTGCVETLSTLLSRHFLLLAAVAGSVALIQIIGLILSFKLGTTIRALED